MHNPNIPGYDLHECLGVGAQSAVYSAVCRETAEPCAVKVLRPQWESHPHAIKLLQRETRALAGLRHPHVVQIKRAFVIRAPHFLVMDLLPGRSLRTLLKEGALPVEQIAGILRDLAEALVVVHRAGFAHGDVTPDNIQIAPAGAVLHDFGCARRLEGDLEPNALLGDEAYRAPELTGSRPRSHRRSDLYSLGKTLRDMLVSAGDVPEYFPQLADYLVRPDPAQRPHPQRLVNELHLYQVGKTSLRRAS